MSATPAPAPMPAWAATVSPLVFSESLVLAAASEVLELEAAVEVPDAVLLVELVADCIYVSHEVKAEIRGAHGTHGARRSGS